MRESAELRTHASTKAVVTKTDVEKLLTICGDVRAFYMHYRALFEPDNPHRTVFGAAAPIFFGDINLIFVKYIILEVCKLGDPAQDFRGNENLSIDFFVRYSDFSTAPEQSDNLNVRATRIRNFIAKLKPARDKLISHWDRNTVLSGIRGLGGADTDEWVDFWLDLQVFVAILCERYLDQRLYFCGGANSDAHVVVDMLRQSVG
jgi:hypothetical protein